MKIFWLVIVALTATILAIALTLQTPAVQTRIADKVVKTVNEKLDGEITFDRIHFKPFTTLVLKNVVIIDKHPIIDPVAPESSPVDTFFRASYIVAKMTLKSLTGSEGVHIDKVIITDADMNLVIEDNPNDGKENIDNLSRIFRIKKGQKKEPSEKELFHIRRVELDDLGFAMKNYSSKKSPYYGGINWNSLDINNIQLKAKDLKFEDGVMSGEVNSLSFSEKSGYTCHQIKGQARVGNGKAIIEDFSLNDPWSSINLPLYMMSYSGVEAFQDYIAEVKMDAEFSQSIVDFRTDDCEKTCFFECRTEFLVVLKQST